MYFSYCSMRCLFSDLSSNNGNILNDGNISNFPFPQVQKCSWHFSCWWLGCEIWCQYIQSLSGDFVSPSPFSPVYFSLHVEQMVMYIRLALACATTALRKKMSLAVLNLWSFPSLSCWQQPICGVTRLTLFEHVVLLKSFFQIRWFSKTY